jgi:prepilin signal peptidase PulO-like enzyme (type II secretory pathway)
MFRDRHRGHRHHHHHRGFLNPGLVDSLNGILMFSIIFVIIAWIFAKTLRKRRQKMLTKRINLFLGLENVNSNIVISCEHYKKLRVDIYG